MLDDLPTWLVAIGLLPWWGRRVIELARDIDRYRDERRRREIRYVNNTAITSSTPFGI